MTPASDYTILIVDDQTSNLDVLSDLLESHGFEVLSACEGEAALEIAQRTRPDLILLDVILPGMDGFEACRRLKADQRTEEIPVIFMTSLEKIEEKIRGLQVEAVDYITKPFQVEEVLARVTTQLRIRSLARELQEANETLERRVEERTAQLAQVNEELQAEVVERISAEEALREDDVRWRSLTENSPDHILTLDQELNIEFANYASPGLTVEELIGTPLYTYVDEDRQAEIKALHEQVLKTGKPASYETEYDTPDGSVIYYESRVVPRILHDEVIGLIVSVRDITGRMQAEEALREAETRYRIIADFASDWGYWQLADGSLCYVSPSCERITGYSAEQFIENPDSLNEIIVPEDQSSWQNHQQVATQKHGQHAVQFRIRRHDGEIRWIEHACRPVMGDQGDFQGFRGSNRDITERKSVEEALKRSEARLRAIFDNSVDAIGVSLNGVHITANPAYLRLFGYETVEELTDKPILDLIAPDEHERIVSYVQHRSKGEQAPSRYETKGIRQDGTEFPMDVRVSTYRLGEQFYAVVILRDITERKWAEEMLGIQRDLAVTLNATQDMGEALACLLETTLRIDGIDCGGVYLVSRQTGGLDLVAHQGLPPQFIETASHYEADSPQAQLVMAGDSIHRSYHDILPEVQRDDARRREGLRAMVIIPIQYEGRLIGAFNLASHTHDQIADNSLEAIKTIAVQVGGFLARLRAEADLRESRDNLQTLFNTIDDFLFILGPQGEILITNPVVQNRLGYAMEELTGQPVTKVHPLDRHEEAQAIIADMLAGKAAFCPVPLMARDGSLIPVETKVTPGKWGDRDVLFGISRDITERKQAEAALRESEGRWQFALEGSRDGVWDWNAVTNEVFFSRRWKEMLGYTEGEISNHLDEWDKRVHPNDKEQCYTDLNRHFNGEVPYYQNEHRVMCKDGSYKWILDRGKVISWTADHKPLRVIGTHTDITERKQVEEELEKHRHHLEVLVKERSAELALAYERLQELDQLKDEFIAGVSHELRTPITNLKMYLRLLDHKPEKKDQFIDTLQQETRRLEHIIEGILYVSQLVQELRELKVTSTDLNMLVNKSVTNSLPKAQDRNLEFIFNEEAGLPSVRGSQALLMRVLNILLSNAVNYTPEKGCVVVSTQINQLEGKTWVRLCIRNTGASIPEDELPRLFERFFRGQAALNAGVPGAGLGLYIAKEIVERHGGRIGVESDEESGKGVGFIVWLPAETVDI